MMLPMLRALDGEKIQQVSPDGKKVPKPTEQIKYLWRNRVHVQSRGEAREPYAG